MSINCLTSSSVSTLTAVSSEQPQAAVQEVAEQTQLHGPSGPSREGLPPGRRLEPVDNFGEYLRRREEEYERRFRGPLRESFVANPYPNAFAMDYVPEPSEQPAQSNQPQQPQQLREPEQPEQSQQD